MLTQEGRGHGGGVTRSGRGGRETAAQQEIRVAAPRLTRTRGPRAGGKILLNKATLHLKRGRRYGLCGPNGAGKVR